MSGAIFPASFLAELRARSPLAAMVGRRVTLKQLGRSWRGPCPIHGGTRPSLSVRGQGFRCFSCGEHGDAIRWEMWEQSIGFVDAVKRLAVDAGLELPQSNSIRIDDQAEIPAARYRAERLKALQAQREAEEATARDRRIRIAHKLWSERLPIGGTIGEAYLTTIRGFTAPAEGWPEDVAFHPPSRSLILPGRTEGGDVQFVHRVFLTIKGDNVREDDARKKKRTDGPKGGAAFRLPATVAAEPVQHAEGGESAIAAWLSNGYATRCRFGPVAQSELVPDVLNVILADDDPADHPTEVALAEARLRWDAAGLRSIVIYPWTKRRFDKSDIADAFCEEGPDAARERISAALRVAQIERAVAEDFPHPPLPDGSYLRPEETNLPAYHAPITESRDEAEYRLRCSIKGFFASSVRVLSARREVARRRVVAIQALPPEATPQEKAAITRSIIAAVAEEFGFGTKRVPRPARQLDSGSQGNGKTSLALAEVAKITGDFTVHKYAPTLAKAEEDLVPLHSDFDRLSRRWVQRGQESVIEQDGDTSRHPCAA